MGGMALVCVRGSVRGPPEVGGEDVCVCPQMRGDEGALECVLGRRYLPWPERNETNERLAVARGGACGGVDMPPSGKGDVGGIKREACGGVRRFLWR